MEVQGLKVAHEGCSNKVFKMIVEEESVCQGSLNRRWS